EHVHATGLMLAPTGVQADAPVPPRIVTLPCPHCGKVVQEMFLFCPYCEEPVREVIPRVNAVWPAGGTRGLRLTPLPGWVRAVLATLGLGETLAGVGLALSEPSLFFAFAAVIWPAAFLLALAESYLLPGVRREPPAVRVFIDAAAWVGAAITLPAVALATLALFFLAACSCTGQW